MFRNLDHTPKNPALLIKSPSLHIYIIVYLLRNDGDGDNDRTKYNSI